MSDADADLLNRYLDGLLGGADLAAFRARLASDPELARAVVRAAADTAIVRAWAAAPQPQPAARPRRWGRSLAALGALAAAVAVAAFVLSRPGATSPEVVARVSHDAGCVWAAGPDGDRVARGRPMELTEGVAEVRTGRGTRLVFEGPASFRFDAADAVRVDAGRVYCDVPPAAGGLRVATADGVVTDLGTAFGVAVSPAAGTEVHVFSGRVVVHADGTAADATLAAGTAGAFRKAQAVRSIPLAAAFVTNEVVYEPFDYPGAGLAGSGGWVDAGGDARRRPVALSPAQIPAYPGLPAPRGRLVEVNQNGTSRPVSRPWPPGYTSALVCLDDDFIKGMANARLSDTGLFALRGGAGDGVWLAARPAGNPQGNPDPRVMNLGLRVGGEVSWAAAPLTCDVTHLVVLDTRGGRARLWVDPAPGPEPPPVVTRPLPGGFRAASIQVGDPANPPYCWWFLDELRVAPTWDALPLAAGV